MNHRPIILSPTVQTSCLNYRRQVKLDTQANPDRLYINHPISKYNKKNSATCQNYLTLTRKTKTLGPTSTASKYWGKDPSTKIMRGQVHTVNWQSLWIKIWSIQNTINQTWTSQSLDWYPISIYQRRKPVLIIPKTICKHPHPKMSS